MNRKITIYLLATLLISIFIGTGARKSGCMFTNEKAKSVVSSFTLLSPSDRANSVTLTPTFVWTDFDSEKNYILQIERLNNIDDTPTFSSSLAYENTTIAANVTSFVMSAGKLSLATPYAWRILALNFHTLTNVEPSNRYFKFTTVLNEQQLTSPSSFTLTSPISGTEIRTTTPTFEWSNSVGETSYIFQISESITFIPLVYQDPDIIYDTTSYNGIPDGTLALNKDYYWRVIAHNDVGDTTASNAPFLIKIRGNPPGSFNLYKPDDDSIQYSLIPTLEWTPAGEAQSYTLEIAKTPFPTTPEYTALITPISSTAVVTYTVPAGVLFVRTKYYWRAKATNLAGDTYSTTYFHFTTFEQGIIPDPFDLTTPADNATDVSWRPELKWNDSIGEEYYVVQIDTNSNFTSTPLTFQITINKDTVSYKVPSGRLTPNIKYYWRVLATNSEGGRISGPIPYYWAFTTSNWTDFLSDTVGGEFLKRAYHTAVWTGPTGAGGTEEVIFWGGVGKESEDEPLTYFQAYRGLDR
ncbi:MAG: hypothetical protein HY762_04645 [Planctomycetes bacterium]|nr:hypothetical protein [Planctomycetota bacterium]